MYSKYLHRTLIECLTKEIYSHEDCYVGRIVGVIAADDDESSPQNSSYVENSIENCCVVDAEMKMMKMHQLKLLILPEKNVNWINMLWAHTPRELIYLPHFVRLAFPNSPLRPSSLFKYC